MIERYLHHLRVELPPEAETLQGARLRLEKHFPRTALRRMTHLGMLLGATLEGLPLNPEDAVVYASTFAETRALEEFLQSFPTASPLLFQTSIHPGGVQQVLIGRQQPIARLWPLAGRKRLVEQALWVALLETAARVVLVGGEERGGWMLEHSMASARSFAFATLLSHEAAGATGQLRFSPGSNHEEQVPTLEDFAVALSERRPLGWCGAGGAWELTWL